MISRRWGLQGCDGVAVDRHEDNEAPADGVTCQVALHHQSLDVLNIPRIRAQPAAEPAMRAASRSGFTVSIAIRPPISTTTPKTWNAVA